jgi:hypothetical protein
MCESIVFKEKTTDSKTKNELLWQWVLADMIQEIHMEDRCIIPLVPNAGEKITITNDEEKFIEKGFTMAQYSAF